jgi:predicted short-subunit dehydrogenase-like oxidoreductase (DUF2520 family)
MRVAIIGGGRVGSVLGRVLVDNGHSVSCVVSRTHRSARRAARFLRCKISSTSVEAVPRKTDIVFIATPHAVVERVAKDLSRLTTLDFKHVSFCHASGMLSARALDPLRRRGARVFSFHPVQTFPRNFTPRQIIPTARGIYYGVDGNRSALIVARRFARALDGKIVEIPPAMRAFYHAACVVASNHLTAMLSIVELMYRRLRAKDPHVFPLFKPIIMATLRNIEKTSPEEALSGPVARGGVETVAKHFAALQEYAPEIVPYFRQLSLETVTLASRKGSITRGQAQALRELIRSRTYSVRDHKEMK